ncbi:MEDS domain-containing protein [Ammoniphilus sp. YIM 78166]|uniref:MEDS domain-containing protein n=1 Tax=Ammoniphilus sp. YIM 78166 TaxID=1644106 RepID=UPI00106F2F0E|nr:MEDS domain-containing protein [Ammoniphilus sp. YIM 78166]
MTMSVPLTKSLKVSQGSHILYFYNSLEGYIENAVSYILTGIELGHHIAFIDSEERYHMILEKLGPVDMSQVHYVSNYDFYEMYQDFHFERILSNLKSIVEPYLLEERMVRIWGHVDWIEQDNMVCKLHAYESKADISLAGLGYTTVCAYNGETVPSNILIQMTRSHEYLMTDEELVRSTLYKTSNQFNPTVFPSLSVQTSIDSEMDLYKKKLDFVHVVSHEVRNPLTVIKAYASLLMKEECGEEQRKRLEAIRNYAVVIDNEISHIINTEQMLSTDALWQKKLILVSPAVAEVFDIMKVKAHTQNIELVADIQLNGKEIILSNLMGFKMVLSNLLSNAIKYSLEGQSVYLKVYKEHDFLFLQVQDEGVGMSEEQLEKLYQKYEKMNQEQSGQGIGLFMVKKLVDHFDGEIEVQSQINKGTTFLVKLPIHP